MSEEIEKYLSLGDMAMEAAAGNYPNLQAAYWWQEGRVLKFRAIFGTFTEEESGSYIEKRELPFRRQLLAGGIQLDSEVIIRDIIDPDIFESKVMGNIPPNAGFVKLLSDPASCSSV